MVPNVIWSLAMKGFNNQPLELDVEANWHSLQLTLEAPQTAYAATVYNAVH